VCSSHDIQIQITILICHKHIFLHVRYTLTTFDGKVRRKLKIIIYLIGLTFQARVLHEIKPLTSLYVVIFLTEQLNKNSLRSYVGGMSVNFLAVSLCSKERESVMV
jgi:hypothetical protein